MNFAHHCSIRCLKEIPLPVSLPSTSTPPFPFFVSYTLRSDRSGQLLPFNAARCSFSASDSATIDRPERGPRPGPSLLRSIRSPVPRSLSLRSFFHPSRSGRLEFFSPGIVESRRGNGEIRAVRGVVATRC